MTDSPTGAVRVIEARKKDTDPNLHTERVYTGRSHVGKSPYIPDTACLVADFTDDGRGCARRGLYITQSCDQQMDAPRQSICISHSSKQL